MTLHSHSDWMARTVGFFVRSKLTVLIIVASFLLGFFAIKNLAREEEPQISVPMFDIFVSFPGDTAEEVEKRIVDLGERKLWEISGVEYIYSTIQSHRALIIVRFKVGEDVEKSLIKLYTKVYSNLDVLPKGASQPLIKLRSIDDVPILALTFFSEKEDAVALRRKVAQIQKIVNAIPNVSETTITGGKKRQFHVLFDEKKLKQHFLTPLEIEETILRSNVKIQAGHLDGKDRLLEVETDSFFKSKEDLENLALGFGRGEVLYLRDIARVEDRADEAESFVNTRFGEHVKVAAKGPLGAVTLSVSKRKGSNATWLCQNILKKVDSLKGDILSKDISYTVTRDYGKTASEKSNELLFHMAIAVFGVSILIGFILGWREAGIVGIAIPMTLSLTLATFYFLGFTLNRITLFALIFSIGILVDDPIVDVENIVRHLRLPENKGRPLIDVTIEAVNEVRSPLILATLTVIAAILPMAFVGGLMGPYMRPIPIGASAAMIFSMMVAFVATPWAATKILKHSHAAAHKKEDKEDFLTRLYRSYMHPLIYDEKIRKKFLWGLLILLLAAAALVPLKLVKMKMLPFDNKNEFQVILNMPEGTPLSKTGQAIEEIAAVLVKVPEVENIQAYVGTSAPYNFNGLVRHYFLRSRPYEADLQVNLSEKHARRRQSHAIANAVRPAIHEIVKRYNAHAQIAEVPPGPPVLSTLVFEIYGPTLAGQREIAGKIETLLGASKAITDVATYVEADREQIHLRMDKDKAALNGITVSQIAQTLQAALEGKAVDLAHLSREEEPVEIVLRLPKKNRENLDSLMKVTFLSKFGIRIPLKELVIVEKRAQDQPIYHKNLMRVNYVIADVAGKFESPAYAILSLQKEISKLELPSGATVSGKGQKKIDQYYNGQPATTDRWALKWDGEWQITYEVFRDMGIAFAAVLILIYILVVGWFQSFKTPLIIMLPIPLTLIGILPAHGVLNVFFTATSMIGLIAGAGIVVRNSIILVDFIELQLKQGASLEEAVIEAGAIRFRPMLLTAAAVVVGASVILFDPIFQGLAVSLMAGEIASTLLSRTAVPVFYYLMMKKKQAIA